MKIDYADKMFLLGWLLHGAGLAVLAITVTVYWLAFYTTVSRQQTADQQRITQVQKLLKIGPETRREHARLTNVHSTLQKRIDKIQKMVPLEAEETAFLSYITGIANDEGLRIVNYRPGSEQKHEDYSTIELSLQCEGSFGSICALVDRVHQLPRVSKVDQLSIRSASSGGLYPFDLKLLLYFGIETDAKEGSDHG